jgi:hypothetical protein
MVRVVRSIKNSCIKYSTQNQHFAKMFTYSDNANYNLNFYYFNLIEISFIWQLFMCLMEFSCAEYSANHSALFRRNIQNLRYL